MANKTGKEFITGYIEELTEILEGLKNQTQKRQKEREAKQKNHSPKQTTQPREERPPLLPPQNSGPGL